MDDLDKNSAGDTGNAPGAKVNEGHYPELRLVKAKFFRGTKNTKPRCFKAWFEVLVPVNGYQAGAVIEYFSKLEHNKYPDHDKDECARTKLLLGALFGYGTVAEIDQNVVLTRELALVGNEETNPMQGRVISGGLAYKDGKFAKWTFAPVLENGKPKDVRPGVKVQAPAQPAFQAPAQLAPAVGGFVQQLSTAVGGVPMPHVVQPPVAAPAAPAIPPGWAPHPSAPGWIYNTANTQEMRQLA